MIASVHVMYIPDINLYQIPFGRMTLRKETLGIRTNLSRNSIAELQKNDQLMSICVGIRRRTTILLNFRIYCELQWIMVHSAVIHPTYITHMGISDHCLRILFRAIRQYHH
jgi:hypothetical protein